jgi:hypothetical protein
MLVLLFYVLMLALLRFEIFLDVTLCHRVFPKVSMAVSAFEMFGSPRPNT